jgi:hypothetical protein
LRVRLQVKRAQAQGERYKLNEEIHDFINYPHPCCRKNYQFKAEIHISRMLTPLSPSESLSSNEGSTLFLPVQLQRSSKACGWIGRLRSGTAGSSACRCWGSAEGEIVAGIERNSTNHTSQDKPVFWGGKKDIPCGILGRRLAHM